MASRHSIRVQGQCEVSGDVLAKGSVVIPDNALIGGRVLTGVERIDVPVSDKLKPGFPDFNPQLRFAETPDLPDPLPPDVTIVGPCFTRGDTTILGDLTLQNAVFYIDGNLEVRGGIKGNGAVISTASVRVENGADLSHRPGDLVALLADGDVTLRGSGSTSSFFQCMVFTRGRFDADGLTIAGVFLAGGGGSVALGTPQMTIKDCEVVHRPEAASIVVDTSGLRSVGPNDVMNLGEVQRNAPSPTVRFASGTFLDSAGSFQPFAPRPPDDDVSTPRAAALNDLRAKILNTAKGDPSSHPNPPMLHHDGAPFGNAIRCDDRTIVVVENVLAQNSEGELYMTNENPSTVRYQVYRLTGETWEQLTPEAASKMMGPRYVNLTLHSLNVQREMMNGVNIHIRNSVFNQPSDQTVYDFNVNTFLSDARPLRVVSWSEL